MGWCVRRGSVMINKKNKAFTLIEVLLAMTILTTCVFIISNLQIRVLNKVLAERGLIERTFWVKRALYKNFLKPPADGKKNVEKKEDLMVTFVTQTEGLDKKSAFREWSEVVRKLKAEVAWKQDKELQELEMISFVWNHKKEQEKR
ncbi:MAG: hypothetical protein US69_C0020G0004 [candidate division TM6 bacterium GW2011_GWF2_38_10]|nr:MAG: hypothetical protein US69_C0020G0004 [candidate division TM6 bacterium GW2011_GWF2_38_10]